MEHSLRFLPATKEGIELINDIGFTILLGAKYFLLDCLFQASLNPTRDESRSRDGRDELGRWEFSGELSGGITVRIEVGLGV